MATRHATGRLRRPSAMQLNQIGIPGGANIRLVRYLPTDLFAIGSSGWTRSAGRSYRRMLLVPVIVVASGAGFGSTLRVEAIPRCVPTLRAHNFFFFQAEDGI